jgi:hypothetical protein
MILEDNFNRGPNQDLSCSSARRDMIVDSIIMVRVDHAFNSIFKKWLA